MADMDDVHNTVSSDDREDDRPIAMRRKRRSGSGSNNNDGANAQKASPSRRVSAPHFGLSTPPQTPQSSKKRVRFSDPGSAILSTGLTPLIRRSSLGLTPSRRQCSLWKRSVGDDDAPLSGSVQFAPLRQVLDGRVQRRLRRNRLSEELNAIATEKRDERARRTETLRLEAALHAKDLEIEGLREAQELASQISQEAGDAVVSADNSAQVQELEAQVTELRAQLQRQESVATGLEANWTLAARDPFDDDDDDNHDHDTTMMPTYDDDNDFTDGMTEILTSTPTRGSFPSPPTTLPNTPVARSSLMHASTQATFPDPARARLESQLKTLQTELSSLKAALEHANERHDRLSVKLSDFIEKDSSAEDDAHALDAALDTVLTQLALSQFASREHSSRFSELKSQMESLGFSANPERTIELLHGQFRQARLDLEYLNPGETSEGFENAKLVDLLVSRLRLLTQKVQEQDADIDQYHEQELSLRQQLAARVDAMASMHAALNGAQQEIMALTSEVQERDASAAKLTRALQGYRDEVQALESLITQLESDNANSEASLRADVDAAQRQGDERVLDEELRRDSVQATADGQEIIIADLDRRLRAAMGTINEVQTQMAAKDALVASMRASATDREDEHRAVLIQRDARASELRDELTRVSTCLEEAHAAIVGLRGENSRLADQVESEKQRGRVVMNAMRGQLTYVIDTAYGHYDEDVSVLTTRVKTASAPCPSAAEVSCTPAGVIRPGQFMDAGLARKQGKKRKRYDGGLGFLEEEEIEAGAKA
ncbi:MAG: hypothetical protein M1818_003053 [Claussenomyces sp. TS43310]|nr:MAG: hypothetical protein M1818_003053 [Claussenomyces sp. TS43310]